MPEPTTTENHQPVVVADWANELVNVMCHLEKPLRGDELSVLKAQVANLHCAETQQAPVPADPTLPTVVRDTDTLEQLAQAVRNEPAVAIDLETSTLDYRAGEIVGVGIAVAAGVYYVPTAHRVRENHKLHPDQFTLQSLADAIDFEHIPLIAHNAKFELKWLRHHLGITPRFVWDTQVAARLLRADKPSGLKDLAVRELDVPDWGLSTRELNDIQFLPIDRVARYCGKDCYYTLQLYERQRACLR